ncbi:MAG TPA: outer membrane lipoprotein carrier protein LolA [Candidatus Limnocylindria bacterium]|jgi:outer membrane lipoprotein carrier protein|nr:outer membrane lipoprotein carrier protein LolA [Candidatus Limnocylindria bacterium]
MCGYIPTLVFLLFVFPGRADTKSSVARLEARYRTPKTLEASFLERYTENGRLVRVEAGTVYFKRPGKMRWDYQAPERNLFLVDGKTAWFYVPTDHTATRVPAKESADWRTPLALLVGDMKLSRVCEHVLPALDERPENPEHAMLYCQLRGAASKSPKRALGDSPSQKPLNGESVFFEIDTNSGDLVRVLVRDPGGVGIEFSFTNWRMDPQVPDSLFRFDVPKGVAIVNGELASGQGGVNR